MKLYSNVISADSRVQTAILRKLLAAIPDPDSIRRARDRAVILSLKRLVRFPISALGFITPSLL